LGDRTEIWRGSEKDRVGFFGGERNWRGFGLTTVVKTQGGKNLGFLRGVRKQGPPEGSPKKWAVFFKKKFFERFSQSFWTTVLQLFGRGFRTFVHNFLRGGVVNPLLTK